MGAGTFELHRFNEKVAANDVLKANAHDSTVALNTTLVPLVGASPTPDAQAVRFRRVSITGTYRPSSTTFLADQSQSGDQGFYVVTPLSTARGDLLVVRGFLAGTNDTRPGGVAAPPTGVVTVHGRLQEASTADDKAAENPRTVINTVNPAQQSRRLSVPMYDAYLNLAEAEPGTEGVRPLPRIDLSNPTGGAGELQLFSYILQWYVFGLLAFASPFLVSRAEIRDARRDLLGIDAARTQFDALAPQTGLATRSGAQVAVRAATNLAIPDDIDPAQRRRAVRLADRYGRSLGIERAEQVDEPVGDASVRRAAAAPGLPRGQAARRSADAPHRGGDDHHGSYNDYLWQLALADGQAPEAPVERDRGDTDEPD